MWPLPSRTSKMQPGTAKSNDGTYGHGATACPAKLYTSSMPVFPARTMGPEGVPTYFSIMGRVLFQLERSEAITAELEFDHNSPVAAAETLATPFRVSLFPTFPCFFFFFFFFVCFDTYFPFSVTSGATRFSSSRTCSVSPDRTGVLASNRK